VLELHDGGGYRRVVTHVDVNGAHLWVEEEGAGPEVVFVHGGLGDSRLWEPVAHVLAQRFRCIRYDLRFYGRSEGPGTEWSSIDDLVGLLDVLDVERAALVGLSLGGGIALDTTLARPARVWALAHVAGGVSGVSLGPYGIEEEFEAAETRGDLETMMALDFRIWAPLGADDLIRELWGATPDARGLPDGASPLPAPDAIERLAEVAVPTLVLVARHDPPDLRAAGETVARRVGAGSTGGQAAGARPEGRAARGRPGGARLVEVDSDHYLTLRNAQQVGELLLEFLAAAAPA
jgi:pimeloyl-ACP methyl ester carboxylesterase